MCPHGIKKGDLNVNKWNNMTVGGLFFPFILDGSFIWMMCIFVDRCTREEQNDDVSESIVTRSSDCSKSLAKTEMWIKWSEVPFYHWFEWWMVNEGHRSVFLPSDRV